MNRLAPLFLAATFAPSLSLADERPYAFTYEATVSAQGEKELEGEKEVVDDEPWALEEKIVFGRDIGKLGFSVNLVAEQEFVGGETILLWGWVAGANYAVADAFRLGVETFGEWETEVGVTTTKAFVGPSAVVDLPFLRVGAVASAWLTMGVGFGLDDTTDDLRARAILGMDW